MDYVEETGNLKKQLDIFTNPDETNVKRLGAARTIFRGAHADMYMKFFSNKIVNGDFSENFSLGLVVMVGTDSEIRCERALRFLENIIDKSHSMKLVKAAAAMLNERWEYAKEPGMAKARLMMSLVAAKARQRQLKRRTPSRPLRALRDLR